MEQKLCPGYNGHLCGKPVTGDEIYCSSNCKGKAFEDEVEELLKIMGYDIKRNIEIDGMDVDMYAELHGGVEVTKIIVECKDKEYNSVEVGDISKFGGLYIALRNKQKVDHAYFITRKEISTNGRIYAEQNGIYVYTIYELANRLVDFSSYISSFIYDYEHFDEYSNGQRKAIVEIMERANLFKFYVYLDCIDIHGKTHSPIDSYIESWIKDNIKNHLCILGDYGTGKSSFGLYLTYKLLLEYKKDSKKRIPFFVPLREFHRSGNIQKMIENLCLKYGIRNATYLQFQKMVESGRLIIIFDGFDEMETKVDKHVIIENFKQLNELVLGNSKTIVTCRTHFFRSNFEVYQYLRPTQVLGKLQTLLGKNIDFDIIELKEFNNEQITQFLKKHTNDWKTYLTTIENTYNLGDLSKRAILLEMIVNTLPELLKLGREKIDAVSLYEVYTNFWIRREDWRSVMIPEEKEFFMEEIALELFRTERYQVHYTRLIELVKDRFKNRNLSDTEIDFFDNDTRTCSFLKRDGIGNYYFIHKSFMEYFIAKRIFEDAKQGKINVMDDYLLTYEVKNFLGQILERDKDIDWFLSLRSDDSWLSGRNIVEIMLKITKDFKDKNLSDLKLINCQFSKINLSGANLSKSNLGNTIFLDCNLDGANLSGASMVETKFGFVKKNFDRWREEWTEDNKVVSLKKTNFSGSVITGAKFHATLDGAIFIGVDGASKSVDYRERRHGIDKDTLFCSCSMKKVDFTDANLKNVKFIGVDLTKAKFNGANLEGTVFEKCQMNDADLRKANILFEDVVRYRKVKGWNGKIETIKIVTKRKTTFDRKSIKGAIFNKDDKKETHKCLVEKIKSKNK